MAEYINREALLDNIGQVPLWTGYNPPYQFETHLALSKIIKILKEVTEEIPAADVVEVVRCRDCKYWVAEKDFGMFCSHWGSTLAESKADDFCSYGERKTENV